jgi:hypothetical protein
VARENYRAIVTLDEHIVVNWERKQKQKSLDRDYEDFANRLCSNESVIKIDGDEIHDVEVAYDEHYECIYCNRIAMENTDDVQVEPQCCSEARHAWQRSLRRPPKWCCNTKDRYLHRIDFSSCYDGAPIEKGKPVQAIYCHHCVQTSIGLLWDRWLPWDKPLALEKRFDVANTLQLDPKTAEPAAKIRRGIKDPWKMSAETIDQFHSYLKVIQTLRALDSDTRDRVRTINARMLAMVDAERKRRRHL